MILIALAVISALAFSNSLEAAEIDRLSALLSAWLGSGVWGLSLYSAMSGWALLRHRLAKRLMRRFFLSAFALSMFCLCATKSALLSGGEWGAILFALIAAAPNIANIAGEFWGLGLALSAAVFFIAQPIAWRTPHQARLAAERDDRLSPLVKNLKHISPPPPRRFAAREKLLDFNKIWRGIWHGLALCGAWLSAFFMAFYRRFQPIARDDIEMAEIAEISPPAAAPPAAAWTAPPPPQEKRAAPISLRRMVSASSARSKSALPALDLIKAPPKIKRGAQQQREADYLGEQLAAVLKDFNIEGEISQIHTGPVITLFEFLPAPGVKSSRIIGLADDIARSMSALSARIANIPGQNAIGIEIPNMKREDVHLAHVLSDPAYRHSPAALPLALGTNISGEAVIANLEQMPHMLVAGTTGSGKSVALNGMILSLLYRLSSDACKLILIDPKMLELSVYQDIPHLLAPVVTEPKKAVAALKWVVREMENRYRNMAAAHVRSIGTYNEKQPDKLPYIVVIIDEMADLMMVAGKEIEAAVQRLAQMARAAGIHLIAATQRPSVDVITGTIKANFPTRISFQLSSRIDSRTILGEGGAEQLLGRGDMLWMMAGLKAQRIHAPFVSDAQVEAVASFLRAAGPAPEYQAEITIERKESPAAAIDDDSGDELYQQARDIVCEYERASTSFLQRKLQIGYNRAARLIERMEEEGLVSPPNHIGKRQILTGKDHAETAR